MSCYLTDAETIGMIARWAAGHFEAFKNEITGMERGRLNAPKIAAILADQNVRSCETCYPTHGPAGGFLDDGVRPSDYVAACCERARYRGYSTSPAAAWRMVATLQYQSRETEDWFETDAYWLCHAIKEAAGKKMAEDLVSVEARRWTQSRR